MSNQIGSDKMAANPKAFFCADPLYSLSGSDSLHRLKQLSALEAELGEVLVYVEKTAFDVFMLEIGEILERNFEPEHIFHAESPHSLLIGRLYTRKVKGLLCSQDDVKKIAHSLLSKWVKLPNNIDLNKIGIYRLIIDFVIPVLGEAKQNQIIEAVESENGDFSNRIFFDLQRIRPIYYRNKLLVELLKTLSDTSQRSRREYLFEWRRRSWSSQANIDKSIPAELIGAVAVSLENDEVRQLCSLGINNDLPRQFKFDVTLIKNDIFNISLLARVIDDEENNYRYEQSQVLVSLINSFNTICERKTENIAFALPWLIALGTRAIDNLIIYQALNNTMMQTTLQELCNIEIPILATRAHDILLRVNGAEVGSVNNVISWWGDKVRAWSPLSLDAPRTTWIGNSNLENLLRDIGRSATEKLPDVDSASEEILTGYLLSNLVNEARPYNDGLKGIAPVLKIDYKALNRPQEKERGADLIIRVKINCSGVTATRIHFVQVKKMNTTEKGYSSWQVDIPQLCNLIKSETSATYWVLNNQAKAKVLCLPAGLVKAYSQEKFTQQTTTLSYLNVRAASIDLGNLLCDLVIGMWIGFDIDEDVCDNKSDIDAFIKEKYNPQNILTIDVGING